MWGADALAQEPGVPTHTPAAGLPSGSGSAARVFHCPRPQGERATGFGVALLLALFGRASEDPLLNLVSPLGCEVDAQEGDAERDTKKRRLV